MSPRGRPRKTAKEIIKEIEVAKEIINEVPVDELAILDSDNDEQKRLKKVFTGFREQNPELWNRDKLIYLEQIQKNGGK